MCADLHAEARDAFLLWRGNGKPHMGYLFNTMRSSRARFKLALRECKVQQSRHTADKLAHKLLNHNRRDFWKEIKKLNNQDQNASLAETVNGQSGHEAIAEMWCKHFSDLPNSITKNNSNIPIEELFP